MPLLQAVILAIIQGIAEFLPISSSAHLALAPWLFGWRDQGLAFDVALHIGTLLAVLIYFFRDWLQILGQAAGVSVGNDLQLRDNPRLLWLLVAGTIPAGLAGLALEDLVETTLRSPVIIGVMLISVALLMGYAEKATRHHKSIAHVSLADALLVGTAQALALVPGTSRSGITMTAALFRGLDRATAARFSFLLSTPITAAAAAKKVYDLSKGGGVPPELQVPLTVGIVVSALTGCVVIAWLLRYLRRFSFRPFIVYRLIFGVIILVLALLSRYPAP